MGTEEEKVVPKLRGEKPSNLETFSGFEVKEIYRPEEIKDIEYERDLGDPGEYPYTRGIHKDMYRKRFWNRATFSGLPTPGMTNERFKYLISKGQTGLVLGPDTPSSIGIDTDHPRARYSCGVTGAPTYSMGCMSDVFDGISLTDINVDLRGDLSHTAISMMSQFLAYVESKGMEPSDTRCSMINNPIHGYSCMNWTNCPIELEVKFCIDTIEYCHQNLPLWHPVCIAGYDMRECGIDAVQELAFSIAESITIYDACLSRGMAIEKVARRPVFALGAHIDFLEEIAKYRAARRMWAHIMKERYNVDDPQVLKLIISIRGDGSSLAAQQPINNVARLTMECLAAVLGGVQSMDHTTYDEPLGEPTEEAANITLNIQHIVAHESGVVNTPDPLGGSYYIESLTNKIEEETYKLLKQIEDMGGFIEAEKSGWFRGELRSAYLQRQKELEEKKRIMVGVNEFAVPKEEEISLPIHPYLTKEKEAFQEENMKQAERFRENRDKQELKKAIDNLRKCAEKGEEENLVRPMVEAYKARATMGEVLGIVREAYGYEYDYYNSIKNPF